MAEAEPQAVSPAPCSPKYSADIQPLVAARCAVNGCHTSGAGIGDFTNYSGLKTKIDNGQLGTAVFDLKIMPPASATKLSNEEFDKLKCWIDNNAPQN